MAFSTFSFSSSSNRHFWKSSSTWKPSCCSCCMHLRRGRSNRSELSQGTVHRNQHITEQGTRVLSRRPSMKETDGVCPLEDPRASTVSGFSFLTCALSSITQTHDGMKSPKPLQLQKQNPLPKQGLGGGTHQELALSTGQETEPQPQAMGGGLGRPPHAGCFPAPLLCATLHAGAAAGGCSFFTLTGKALAGLGSRMCPMHLPWDASSLPLHTPQSMFHAVTGA